jgi:hypothetical protein
MLRAEIHALDEDLILVRKNADNFPGLSPV